LGFNPAAVVWHHRRNSLPAYWKQQVQYGKAEAMLERKWPEKYSSVGHHEWRGRIYGARPTGVFPFLKKRIYHGIWGTAPFQSIYEPKPGTLLSLSLTAEWDLVIFVLLAFSSLGAFWKPLLLTMIPLLLATGISLFQAVMMASHASFPGHSKTLPARQLGLKALIACLHLLQPLARLLGRMQSGLAPWRRHQKPGLSLPRPQRLKYWCENWQAPEKRLEVIEADLRAQRSVVERGGDYDYWDFEIRGGLFGSLRACMTVEDHGSGTQLVRFRTWPRFAVLTMPFIFLLVTLSTMSAISQAWLALISLGIITIGLITIVFLDCAAAWAALSHALERAGYVEKQ
jgi:hypothetical protein